MPAGKQAERKLAVKLEEVEWWQKPPVLRRERLHAGGVTEIRLVEMHDKMHKMVEWMVPKSPGQVEPHIAGRFGGMQVCSASAEVPLVLFSTSSISILSSIVVVSMASKKRRLPRPRSRSPSSPFPTRHPQTQRALVREGQTAATPRSGRIERHTARG